MKPIDLTLYFDREIEWLERLQTTDKAIPYDAHTKRITQLRALQAGCRQWYKVHCKEVVTEGVPPLRPVQRSRLAH